MKWFHRKPKVFKIDINSAYPTLPAAIKHEMIVRHAPRPRPNMLQIQWEDSEGRLWQTPPVQITGQAIAPISIELARITNRPEDNSKPPIVFRLLLDYDRSGVNASQW